MKISKRYCDICGKELNFKETSITKLILDTCEHPSPQSFPPLNYDLCWDCSVSLKDHIIGMKKTDESPRFICKICGKPAYTDGSCWMTHDLDNIDPEKVVDVQLVHKDCAFTCVTFWAINGSPSTEDVMHEAEKKIANKLKTWYR